MNLFAVDLDVPAAQLREIHARHHLPMHQHEQPVTGEKVRQDRIVFLSGYDLVHVVDHGLQSLQPLDALDYAALAGDAGVATGQRRPQGFERARPHARCQQRQQQRDEYSDGNPGNQAGSGLRRSG